MIPELHWTIIVSKRINDDDIIGKRSQSQLSFVCRVFSRECV